MEWHKARFIQLIHVPDRVSIKHVFSPLVGAHCQFQQRVATGPSATVAGKLVVTLPQDVREVSFVVGGTGIGIINKGNKLRGI